MAKRSMPISKPTTATKPAAKVAAKVAKVATKPTTPTVAAKVAKGAKPTTPTTKGAKVQGKPAAEHVRHDKLIGAGTYLANGGESATLNLGNGSSSAAVRKRPTSEPTDRTDGLLADLKKAFGTKPFQRGNIGAGALGRNWYLGFVEHISGGTKYLDPIYGECVKGEGATFKLTASGMARKV